MDTKELMAHAQSICLAAKHGAVSYGQAKAKVVPILGRINKIGKKIASKYGIRYKPITFSGLMR